MGKTLATRHCTTAVVVLSFSDHAVCTLMDVNKAKTGPPAHQLSAIYRSPPAWILFPLIFLYLSATPVIPRYCLATPPPPPSSANTGNQFSHLR